MLEDCEEVAEEEAAFCGCLFLRTVAWFGDGIGPLGRGRVKRRVRGIEARVCLGQTGLFLKQVRACAQLADVKIQFLNLELHRSFLDKGVTGVQGWVRHIAVFGVEIGMVGWSWMTGFGVEVETEFSGWGWAEDEVFGQSIECMFDGLDRSFEHALLLFPVEDLVDPICCFEKRKLGAGAVDLDVGVEGHQFRDYAMWLRRDAILRDTEIIHFGW